MSSFRGRTVSFKCHPLRFPTLARKFSECKSALQPGQMAGDLGAQSPGDASGLLDVQVKSLTIYI